MLQQYSDLLHPSFSRVISMCVNMVRVIHTLSRFYWCAFILDSVCVFACGLSAHSRVGQRLPSQCKTAAAREGPGASGVRLGLAPRATRTVMFHFARSTFLVCDSDSAVSTSFPTPGPLPSPSSCLCWGILRDIPSWRGRNVRSL